jgi:TetR/AcrR family tetracycline transcriptional repressor
VTATSTRRARGSLHPDEVVDAALAVVDDDGVEALTMRRLADRLGVNPMTLYLRFENKDALLAAMVARRLAGVRPPSAAGSIEDRLVAWSASVREQLVGVGDLLPALRPDDHLSSAMLEGSESGLALLAEAGLAGAASVAAFRSLFWQAVGFAALGTSLRAHAPALLGDAALSVDTHPHLHAAAPHLDDFDPVDLVERTTRALVRGLIDDPSTPGGTT